MDGKISVVFDSDALEKIMDATFTLEASGTTHPVSLDDTWKDTGYPSRSLAVVVLLRLFQEGRGYEIRRRGPTDVGPAGEAETYHMSIEAFVIWGERSPNRRVSEALQAFLVDRVRERYMSKTPLQRPGSTAWAEDEARKLAAAKERLEIRERDHALREKEHALRQREFDLKDRIAKIEAKNACDIRTRTAVKAAEIRQAYEIAKRRQAAVELRARRIAERRREQDEDKIMEDACLELIRREDEVAVHQQQQQGPSTPIQASAAPAAADPRQD